MEKVQQIKQAYLQTPWRRQVQYVGGSLLFLVIAALFTVLRLSISANTIAIGREIQFMRLKMEGSYRVDRQSMNIDEENQLGEEEQIIPIEELQIQIADLEAELARKTSSKEMRERARKLGFHPAGPDEIMYIKTANFKGRQPVQLGSPPQPVSARVTVLSPAYKQSLIDWLSENIQKAVKQIVVEVRP